ncbi:MAG: carbon storage regulator CsrA [Desulfuromonas sp.]|nr:carbon storage regulator CsrA [Desulfuromonas sp.]
MLVLTRKVGEGIIIGDDIKLTIVDIKGGSIRIGIDAPRSKKIHRQEVYDIILEQNRAATSWSLEDLDALSNILPQPKGDK